MTHDEALREMSAERYLLGELTGEPRELFEEHLFDCQLCAADVTAGVQFLRGARAELARVEKAPAARRQWLSPAWLVPALAASLVAVAYQAAVVEPGLRLQVARADAPAIVSSVVLTGGATRGGDEPRVVAPEHGSFLLSVDIPAIPASPAGSGYTGYVCSLKSPEGVVVWRGSVTLSQANDAVLIRVPAAATKAGENTLVVQGVSGGDAAGAKLVDLAEHRFVLEISK